MAADYIDLDLALRLHFPIVVIESHDEVRAVRMLKKAVIANLSLGELNIWSAATGLQRSSCYSSKPLAIEGEHSSIDLSADQTSDPEAMLRHVKEYISHAVILLPDFHPYLSNPVIVRLLKEIAQNHYVSHITIVLVSHAISLPDELERLCTHVEMQLPDIETIKAAIEKEIKLWSGKNKKEVQVDEKAREMLAQNLLGLTHGDITRLIRNAIYDDGAISASDVKEVMEAKYKLLSNDGMVSFSFEAISLDDIGGFDSLKEWLSVRRSFFVEEAREDCIDVPKGMLLVGVQGCGKSLAAKAVSGSWGVPLLKLDMAALYSKYIGESEKNIREALKLAEVLSPCVLWIDEIEKAIHGSGDETGTSNRVLGTILTWMAEKQERVFIVATSNDIDKLPPELVRKGRIDEIFFVDLPEENARADIIKLHLEKRGYSPDEFNLEKIASCSAGFSGAELEQAVVSARYKVLAKKQPLATRHIISEIEATHPLSVVRSEVILELRNWAEGRTVKV